MAGDTEAEITELFDNYRKSFSAGDIEGCLRYFAIPCTLISFGRVLYLDTPEKFVSHWGGTKQKMAGQGISHGRIAGLKVFPLDDDTAAAAVIFQRLDDKDQVITEQAGAYHLFKGADGWKVYSFIMHRSDRWLGAQVGR